MFRDWKFEDGYWQGPLWPIKGFVYAGTGLVIVGGLVAMVTIVVGLAVLWM